MQIPGGGRAMPGDGVAVRAAEWRLWRRCAGDPMTFGIDHRKVGDLRRMSGPPFEEALQVVSIGIAFEALDSHGQHEIDALDRAGRMLGQNAAQRPRIPFGIDQERLSGPHDLPAADADDQGRRQKGDIGCRTESRDRGP